MSRSIVELFGRLSKTETKKPSFAAALQVSALQQQPWKHITVCESQQGIVEARKVRSHHLSIGQNSVNSRVVDVRQGGRFSVLPVALQGFCTKPQRSCLWGCRFTVLNTNIKKADR